MLQGMAPVMDGMLLATVSSQGMMAICQVAVQYCVTVHELNMLQGMAPVMDGMLLATASSQEMTPICQVAGQYYVTGQTT